MIALRFIFFVLFHFFYFLCAKCSKRGMEYCVLFRVVCFALLFFFSLILHNLFRSVAFAPLAKSFAWNASFIDWYNLHAVSFKIVYTSLCNGKKWVIEQRLIESNCIVVFVCVDRFANVIFVSVCSCILVWPSSFNLSNYLIIICWVVRIK